MIEKLKVIDRVKYTFRRKYRSGHRIHSPYVFKLVRELFMKHRSDTALSDAELTVALCQSGLKYDYSYRVGQFFRYNDFKNYVFNPKSYAGEDCLVLTKIDDLDSLDAVIEQMKNRHKRSAVVILNIYRNKECRRWWKLQQELSLDLYRMGIVIYDENLNREYFKLKI